MHLSPVAPRVFSVIPEWVVDDICEFYLYVLRYDLLGQQNVHPLE